MNLCLGVSFASFSAVYGPNNLLIIGEDGALQPGLSPMCLVKAMGGRNATTDQLAALTGGHGNNSPEAKKNRLAFLAQHPFPGNKYYEKVQQQLLEEAERGRQQQRGGGQRDGSPHRSPYRNLLPTLENQKLVKQYGAPMWQARNLEQLQTEWATARIVLGEQLSAEQAAEVLGTLERLKAAKEANLRNPQSGRSPSPGGQGLADRGRQQQRGGDQGAGSPHRSPSPSDYPKIIFSLKNTLQDADSLQSLQEAWGLAEAQLSELPSSEEAVEIRKLLEGEKQKREQELRRLQGGGRSSRSRSPSPGRKDTVPQAYEFILKRVRQASNRQQLDEMWLDYQQGLGRKLNDLRTGENSSESQRAIKLLEALDQAFETQVRAIDQQSRVQNMASAPPLPSIAPSASSSSARLASPPRTSVQPLDKMLKLIKTEIEKNSNFKKQIVELLAEYQASGSEESWDNLVKGMRNLYRMASQYGPNVDPRLPQNEEWELYKALANNFINEIEAYKAQPKSSRYSSVDLDRAFQKEGGADSIAQGISSNELKNNPVASNGLIRLLWLNHHSSSEHNKKLLENSVQELSRRVYGANVPDNHLQSLIDAFYKLEAGEIEKYRPRSPREPSPQRSSFDSLSDQQKLRVALQGLEQRYAALPPTLQAQLKTDFALAQEKIARDPRSIDASMRSYTMKSRVLDLLATQGGIPHIQVYGPQQLEPIIKDLVNQFGKFLSQQKS